MRHSTGQTGPPPSAPAAIDRSIAVFVLLWAIMLWVGPAAVPRFRQRAPRPLMLDKVDPNVAPWSELTVLPRIGEGLAKAVVQHRESTPVSGALGGGQSPFTRAADLAHVRGIGPKTVQRIAGHLRFDAR